MTTKPKPPQTSSVKPLTATARPGFPVRLKPAIGMAPAAKPRAVPDRSVAALGLVDLKPGRQVAMQGLTVKLNQLNQLHQMHQMHQSNQSKSPREVDLDLQALRTRMVHKLAAQGVTDARVLTAMGLVQRHRFVDTALGSQAYEDTSLPIGLGQTISKPNVVARMLELLGDGLRDASGKLGRVLEIGTGCGYQAALLSHLAVEVYSIERLRGLHDKARENLRTFRLPNLHLLFGDGMIGFAKGAPYAAIISAAGGDAIPDAWIDQLAIGGRLVAPMQVSGGAQALVVIDKTPQGTRQTVLEAVNFVPLKSGIS